MTLALAGVVGYLALGTLSLLGGGRYLGVLAWALGAGALLLWAPGFAESTLGVGSWGIQLAGDGVAVAFWALALILHGTILWGEWKRTGAFHPLVTLLFGTTLALVLSRDLFNLYVCLELTSLLSFLLVGYESRPGSVWASLQYLILTTVGMILYLVGLGLVYGCLGTLSLGEIARLSPSLSDPALAVGVGLLLSGAAVKGGVFLLGLWLPQAHGRAPSSVSALLSGLVVKMGIVALLRIGEAFAVGQVLVALGLVTGFGSLIYALWERDIKFFLAYSTMSQLGYLLVGFGLGGGAAFGALLYALAHGLFKALLFLSAGEAIAEAGTRRIAGLAGRLSWGTALSLAVGTWAIVGLPPLPGFVAKEVLTQGAPPHVKWALFALGVGTAAAFTKLLPLLRPGGRGPSWKGGLPLVLALLAFGGWGLANRPGLLSPGLWGGSVLAAALGIGLGWLAGRVRPRLPRLTLDRAALAILVSALGIAFGLVLRM